MDLADEQTATDFEGDIQRRLIGATHSDAVEGLVVAVVGDVGHRRVEEQREVDAGEQQDDERVERDLTQ